MILIKYLQKNQISHKTIKKSNLEKVFERFYQIDRKKYKKQEGTGLGLTICKAIIELLGGKIWIESEHGIGTTIFFNIPIEEPIEEPVEVKEIKPVNINVCEGKRVLIIDDNDINYDLLNILLLSLIY